MNPVQGNASMYNAQIGYGEPLMTGGCVATEALLPTFNSVMNDSCSMLPKTTSDSGLTYNVPISTSAPRKRSRVDSINPSFFSYPTAPTSYKNNSCAAPFSFLGEDISLQIQQQQFDVDRLISQHVSPPNPEPIRLVCEMGIFPLWFIDFGCPLFFDFADGEGEVGD